jgi:carbonic anhydrase
MCADCDRLTFNRRKLLSLSAAGIAATTFFVPRRSFAAGAATTSVSADEAFAKLKAGNEKYVGAPQLCAVELLKQREGVAKAQAPWATIITCSDSRVPPELLFGGLGLGEIFVGRNAGNMVDTATMGTIEYGAEHLGIPLIVVMGHERCGAVAAACAVVEKHEKFPGSIGPMVNAIVPAAKAVRGQPGDFVDNTVRESAKRTATKVATKSEIVSHLIKAKKVKVIAARYDLDNGRVEFLN